MKLAVVVWKDVDWRCLEALAERGVALTAFTRWHDGQPKSEARGPWRLERCPHTLGGGPEAEGLSFARAVVARSRELGLTSTGCDVAHAIDAVAMPAAGALASFAPGTLTVRSIHDDTAHLALDEDQTAPGLILAPHPFTADRFAAHHPALASRVAIVNDRTPEIAAEQAASTDHPPALAIWLERGRAVDPVLMEQALRAARPLVPGLTARVLGSSTGAVALRRHLRASRLLDDRPGPSSSALWDQAVGASRALALPGRRPWRDPSATRARALGVPVLGLGEDGSGFADVLVRAMSDPPALARRAQAARSGAIESGSPDAIARGWLEAYLEAGTPTARAAPAKLLASVPAIGRSWVELIAAGPHEALAHWSVRPDDWARAIEWLGPDGARAALVLRLSDITDLHYNGSNAHASWDLVLDYGATHRQVHLDHPGRSLAATLAVRSESGFLLPLARGRLTHLPRASTTTNPATRRLTSLSRA